MAFSWDNLVDKTTNLIGMGIEANKPASNPPTSTPAPAMGAGVAPVGSTQAGAVTENGNSMMPYYIGGAALAVILLIVILKK